MRKLKCDWVFMVNFHFDYHYNSTIKNVYPIFHFSVYIVREKSLRGKSLNRTSILSIFWLQKILQSTNYFLQVGFSSFFKKLMNQSPEYKDRVFRIILNIWHFRFQCLKSSNFLLNNPPFLCIIITNIRIYF